MSQSTIDCGLKYQEFTFNRVNAARLPGDVRHYIEQNTSPLRRLGFTTLGTWRLREGAMPCVARYLFLEDDRRVFADVTVSSGIEAVAFESVFTDGLYLETSTLPHDDDEDDDERPTPDGDHLLLVHVPNAPLELVFAAHLKAVRTYQRETGHRPVRFERGDLEDVIIYGQRLVWQVEQRLGWAYGVQAAVPPARVFEQQPRRRRSALAAR